MTLIENLTNSITDILLSIYIKSINTGCKIYDNICNTMYNEIERSEIYNSVILCKRIYNLSPQDLILIYIYANRYNILFNDGKINLYFINYLLTSFLILSKKMYSNIDKCYSNKYYASIGYLELKLLNDYEYIIFQYLNLNVDFSEYYKTIIDFQK
jgi:hypothetical protein